MNDKENLAEWIDRFTNNELEGEDLQKFLDMLRSDPELRKEVKLDHDLNEILLEEDILDLRQKLMEQINRNDHERFDLRQLLIAASVLLLIGIVFLLCYTGLHDDREISRENRSLMMPEPDAKHHPGVNQSAEKKPQKNEDPVSGKDTIRSGVKPGDRPLLASNYTPFPSFESLVGTMMRSVDFKLIAPVRHRIQKGTPVRFQWKTGAGTIISLIIMNNKGNPVFEMKPGTNLSQEVGKNELIPGLYYYKFLENGEIIYFGKFIIE